MLFALMLISFVLAFVFLVGSENDLVADDSFGICWNIYNVCSKIHLPGFLTLLQVGVFLLSCSLAFIKGWSSPLRDHYYVVAGLKISLSYAAGYVLWVLHEMLTPFAGSLRLYCRVTHGTAYQILNVSPTARPYTILWAYRQLAQPYADSEYGFRHEIFQALTSAYVVLADPRERQIYDEQTLRLPHTLYVALDMTCDRTVINTELCPRCCGSGRKYVLWRCAFCGGKRTIRRIYYPVHKRICPSCLGFKEIYMTAGFVGAGRASCEICSNTGLMPARKIDTTA